MQMVKFEGINLFENFTLTNGKILIKIILIFFLKKKLYLFNHMKFIFILKVKRYFFLTLQNLLITSAFLFNSYQSQFSINIFLRLHSISIVFY